MKYFSKTVIFIISAFVVFAFSASSAKAEIGYLQITKNTADGDGIFNYNIFPTPSTIGITTIDGYGSKVIALDLGLYNVYEKSTSGWQLNSATCGNQISQTHTPVTLTDDSSIGTAVWSNPLNAATSDSIYTTVSLTNNVRSHYLKATNFGFNIPSDATIEGLKVSVKRKSAVAGNTADDNAVRIIKSGIIGLADRSNTTRQWTSIDTVITYGGSSDLWGETLTPANINASNFGFAISVRGGNGMGSVSASIDQITITVTYTTADNGTPVNNGVKDVTIYSGLTPTHCTFSNIKKDTSQQTSLKIIESTTGGGYEKFDYTITSTDHHYTTSITTSGNIGSSELTIAPNTYTISQIAKSGWTSNGAYCDNWSTQTHTPVTITDDSSMGTVIWSNPLNAATNGSAYATAYLANNVSSHYLASTNFGFDIPSDARIKGIKVSVKRKSAVAGGTAIDNAIRIIKNGIIGSTDRSNTNQQWTTTDTVITYGDAYDLWGTTFTADDINASNFGFAISVKGQGTSGSTTASINQITITVTYITTNNGTPGNNGVEDVVVKNGQKITCIFSDIKNNKPSLMEQPKSSLIKQSLKILINTRTSNSYGYLSEKYLGYEMFNYTITGPRENFITSNISIKTVNGFGESKLIEVAPLVTYAITGTMPDGWHFSQWSESVSPPALSCSNAYNIGVVISGKSFVATITVSPTPKPFVCIFNYWKIPPSPSAPPLSILSPPSKGSLIINNTLNLDPHQIPPPFSTPFYGRVDTTFNYIVNGPSPFNESVKNFYDYLFNNQDYIKGIVSGGTKKISVNPGKYDIAQTSPDGWTISSVICDNEYEQGPNGLTDVIVESGETTICTFTNTNYNMSPKPIQMNLGYLRIVTNATGGDATFIYNDIGIGPTTGFGPTDVNPYDHPYNSTSITTVGGTYSKDIPILITGSYQTTSSIYSFGSGSQKISFSETVPDGWTLNYAYCDHTYTPGAFIGPYGTTDPKSAVNRIKDVAIVAGETTTCTFGNTKNGTSPISPQGYLKIVKKTKGGDGTFNYVVPGNLAMASRATITTDDGEGSTVIPVNPGRKIYQIIELHSGGTGSNWVFDSAVCDDQTSYVNSYPSLLVNYSNNLYLSYIYHLDPPICRFGDTSACNNISNVVLDVSVPGGETTTCTFNSTLNTPPGYLKIVTNTIGGDGIFHYIIFPTPSIVSVSTVGGTGSSELIALDPGIIYSIKEIGPIGSKPGKSSASYHDSLNNLHYYIDTSGIEADQIKNLTIFSGNIVTLNFDNSITPPPPPASPAKVRVKEKPEPQPEPEPTRPRPTIQRPY